MSKERFLNLQESEITVVDAASRIFAAYINAGFVDKANEEGMMHKCVGLAVRMALAVDTAVLDEKERMKT